MELSVKKLSVIFTIAASLGGVIGGTAVYQVTAPTPIVQKHNGRAAPPVRVNTANDNHVVEAEVLKVEGSDMTVRAHTWVGQFMIASISDRAAQSSTSHYVANVTDAAGNRLTSVRRGQTVYLHGIEDVATPGLTAEIPNIRPRADVVPGPIRGHVLKDIDGDTFGIMAEVWKGTYVLIDIRLSDMLDGIDTPEKKGRAKCKHEADLAEQASATTKALISDKDVLLYNIKYEKYGGRVLAGVKTMDGQSVADVLIQKGLARPYNGGKKSSWCK